MILLVPSDPLQPRRPDEHFQEEAAVARSLGHRVELVDHDALCREGGAADAVSRVSRGMAEGDAVYRGWMLRSEQYGAFADTLGARDVTLRTNAKQYQQAHELPSWYAHLAGLTPESVWTEGSSLEAFRACCKQLGSGSAVLRDYSKSMKHHWHEAAFVRDVTDVDAATAIARRFLELRDDAFVGGLVLRRFEPLRPEEVRTWWLGGECVLTTAHPDTPHAAPPAAIDLDALAPRMADLGLPFTTVDLALRADGVWRVMELGDGQVSDRPRTSPAETFVRSVAG